MRESQSVVPRSAQQHPLGTWPPPRPAHSGTLVVGPGGLRRAGALMPRAQSAETSLGSQQVGSSTFNWEGWGGVHPPELCPFTWWVWQVTRKLKTTR